MNPHETRIAKLEKAMAELQSVNPSRLLKDSEVQELLGVSRSFLAIGRMKGEGPPYVRVGNSVRYNPDDLRTWIHEQTVIVETGKVPRVGKPSVCYAPQSRDTILPPPRTLVQSPIGRHHWKIHAARFEMAAEILIKQHGFLPEEIAHMRSIFEQGLVAKYTFPKIKAEDTRDSGLD